VAPLGGGKHGQFVGRGDYEEQRLDYEDPYGRMLYRLNRATPPNKLKQSAIQSHQGNEQLLVCVRYRTNTEGAGIVVPTLPLKSTRADNL
jgi:hypothetical protein